MQLSAEKLCEALPQNNQVQALDACWQQYFRLYSKNDFLDKFNIQIDALQNGDERTVYQYYTQSIDSKGTCIIVHGYMDHSGLYSHLIQWCLEQGWDVLVYDKLGHGLSSGEPYAIRDFSDYVKQLEKVLAWLSLQHSGRWMLVGQSTGAAVIMEYLLNKQFTSSFQIDRYLLLAPLLRNKPFFKTKFKFKLLRHFVNKVKKGLSTSSHDHKFLGFINYQDPLSHESIKVSWLNAMFTFEKRFAEYAICKTPVEVIQGDDDQTVDWRYNLKAIENKFSNSEFAIIKEAKHNLVNEAKEFRQQVFQAIGQSK